MWELGIDVWIVSVAIFAGVAAVVLLVATWLAPLPEKSLARVENLLSDGRYDTATPAQRLASWMADRRVQEFMRHLLPDDETRRTRIINRLVRAGFYEPSTLGLFMLLKIGLMAAPMAIGLSGAFWFPWAWHWTLFGGAILGLLGMLVPDAILNYMMRQRQRNLRLALPDLVDLTVACVEGGMGLAESITQVHREMRTIHPLLATELDFVMRDAHLGQTLSGAFERMHRRTGIEEVKGLANFVQQAQRYGAEMGTALRELSDMLRFQREQRAEEMAQQASVKILIPTVLFIFPTIFVALAGPAALQIQESFQDKPEVMVGQEDAR